MPDISQPNACLPENIAADGHVNLQQEPARDNRMYELLHVDLCDGLSDEEPPDNASEQNLSSESFDEEPFGNAIEHNLNSESSDEETICAVLVDCPNIDQNAEPSGEEQNGELCGDEPNSETIEPRDEPLEDGFFGDEEPMDILDAVSVNAEPDPLQVKVESIEIFNMNVAEEVIIDNMGFNVVKVDDDLEMFFDSDASFKPKVHTHQVKPNDEFSGNIPFSIDVSTFSVFRAHV